MNTDWKKLLVDKLPLLGHRNWILVVDKAYPLQNSNGLTVCDSGESLPVVLEYVLNEVSKSTHVHPVVYFDQELKALDESYCSGINELRSQIIEKVNAAHPYAVNEMIHDEIIEKVDNRSKVFNMLVIKTEALLPYTSVFIELECGYWKPDQEKKLRDSMR